MMGAFLSRAASSDATTVEEEVTFCMRLLVSSGLRSDLLPSRTYNGGDGKLLLLGVLEELVNVVTHDLDGSNQPVQDKKWGFTDDAGFPAQICRGHIA